MEEHRTKEGAAGTRNQRASGPLALGAARRGRRAFWIPQRLPKKLHVEGRELLTKIPYAPTRDEAEKAVTILETDWEWMLTFYDFPEEHWSEGERGRRGTRGGVESGRSWRESTGRKRAGRKGSGVTELDAAEASTASSRRPDGILARHRRFRILCPAKSGENRASAGVGGDPVRRVRVDRVTMPASSNVKGGGT